MNSEKVARRGLARRQRASRVVLVLLAAGSANLLAGVAQASPLLDSRVNQQSIGETICRPGYADTVALPFEQAMAHKHRLLAQHGIDVDDGPSYALDQRVPVVLGGSPHAEANLDLLPWAGHAGERRKVRLTVQLKRCVCGGQISLATAQAVISGDWVHEYERFTRMACGANTASKLMTKSDDSH
ncbi:hypothetical protein [Paraburkholderia adhaesiva]|uniref:hypothetical protein n=1 Tax=Paraburkholderia adhaesiva TaxID=2883244 RepID=UPI001F1E9502|nr:hypothetical protein [Paraburkholderia adhaesiva]